MNIPPRIGMVVSSGLATLAELQTVYGIRDLYDLIEVINVDAHNQRVIAKRPPKGE